MKLASRDAAAKGVHPIQKLRFRCLADDATTRSRSRNILRQHRSSAPRLRLTRKQCNRRACRRSRHRIVRVVSESVAWEVHQH
ncbi:hypothetical protein PHSY_000126 [Pseudozyma hubeiensis SY62]|uniref:Uncharacterized protein n=1 Tax=Pseudozyma hubeiensis (strain SY62) TaxID=1305764 RepID=R9NVX0_PSEHS|nr:hypothetical protein PHSY_000126 [Pseudozyma hubeiensis SY62]GAC92572.1 hypothetical protein PHSY_000126 [Pseudozyma hubeiensis SY62]